MWPFKPTPVFDQAKNCEEFRQAKHAARSKAMEQGTIPGKDGGGELSHHHRWNIDYHSGPSV